MTTREIEVRDPFDILFTLPRVITRDLSQNPINIENTLREYSKFKTDIKETNDAYQVIADFPGANKQDIDIQYDNNTLTITYEKTTNNTIDNNEDDNNTKNKEQSQSTYVIRERNFEKVSRSFNFENIQEDNITASFDNGVLTITLPKETQKEANTHITID